MSAAARRLDELRARREARAADRAAFEERRRYGLAARHATKLAYLATQADSVTRTHADAGAKDATAAQAEEGLKEPDNSISPVWSPVPEVA